MLGTKVLGYMLTIKYGDKLIKGLETAGLKIKPNFEETLLKEFEGVAEDEFIDFDTELSVGGKTVEKDVTEALTHEDFETLREAASVGAEVAFIYGRMTVGAKIVSGLGKLTDYSEDGNSEKKLASFSGGIKAKKGSVVFGTSV